MLAKSFNRNDNSAAIKSRLKLLIRALVKHDAIWNLIWPIIRIANRFSTERQFWLPIKTAEANNKLKAVFSDLKVRTGPFKGMLYPDFVSYGSHLFPKLLGSYEQELHFIIEGLSRNDYSEILDIGCAEGYYAVGLALRFRHARIYAFDIDVVALEACKTMAKINGVSERMDFQTFCESKTLSDRRISKRGLIICDCEGYEVRLFENSIANNLIKCDVLIELHDRIEPGSTDKILRAFSNTHTATMIKVKKRNISKYPELKSLNNFEKQVAVYEGRPMDMQWVYLVPKNRTEECLNES